MWKSDVTFLINLNKMESKKLKNNPFLTFVRL